MVGAQGLEPRTPLRVKETLQSNNQPERLAFKRTKRGLR